MTANAGYHAYATGDVLTAAQVQYNLQNQTVMYFATTTARTTALTGVLVEGMVSYIPANGIEYYNGSAWVSISQAVTALTTKGDLLTYSTQDTRLPVGADGTTLVADSSTATGLKYEAQSMRLVGSTTFSAASSASLDSLFSSTYENYKVYITVNAANQVVLNYRLRASAADNTTTNYSNQYLVADNTTVVASRATGLTSGTVGQMVTGGYSAFELTIYRPFATDATILRSVSACNVAGGYISDYQSNFSTLVSFTGLSIIPVSGTITGAMRVYGLRNS